MMEQLMFLAAVLNIVSAGINLTAAIIQFRQKKNPSPVPAEKG